MSMQLNFITASVCTVNTQIRLDSQKAHEDEMKVIFAAERERIEDECKKLRQQLVTATAEVILTLMPWISLVAYITSTHVSDLQGAREGGSSVAG